MGRALLNWDEWNPGLDTDAMTLGAVLATMPAAAAEDVPAIIRKYENPDSPDALPGAIALDRHDCLHVLLGRGLHVQDEAFIIGRRWARPRTFRTRPSTSSSRCRPRSIRRIGGFSPNTLPATGWASAMRWTICRAPICTEYRSKPRHGRCGRSAISGRNSAS
ncbi:MAG: hypothetical protein JKP98_25385 [Rhodobacteraceae bacterium]|nr:hypothetical protein [Paracoccaceae bacterium]